MKILVMNGKEIFGAGENIEFGLFAESNDRCKWRICNAEGVQGYVLDGNLAASTEEECSFRCYEVDSIPEDYAEGKYFFMDGEFVANADYVAYESPLPQEELTKKAKELEAAIAVHNNEIASLFEYTAELLYNQCLGKLGMESEVSE